jgi:hypothetical protein
LREDLPSTADKARSGRTDDTSVVEEDVDLAPLGQGGLDDLLSSVGDGPNGDDGLSSSCFERAAWVIEVA